MEKERPDQSHQSCCSLGHVASSSGSGHHNRLLEANRELQGKIPVLNLQGEPNRVFEVSSTDEFDYEFQTYKYEFEVDIAISVGWRKQAPGHPIEYNAWFDLL